ncbi:MAG: hypothetical protein PVG86_10360 [Desulfobacterales bacterium]|jgi:hypothetical protein
MNPTPIDPNMISTVRDRTYFHQKKETIKGTREGGSPGRGLPAIFLEVPIKRLYVDPECPEE